MEQTDHNPLFETSLASNFRRRKRLHSRRFFDAGAGRLRPPWHRSPERLSRSGDELVASVALSRAALVLPTNAGSLRSSPNCGAKQSWYERSFFDVVSRYDCNVQVLTSRTIGRGQQPIFCLGYGEYVGCVAQPLALSAENV
jgi:hypothetical protein